MKKEKSSPVVKVYANINQHRLVAELIRKHSTNKRDVRDVALEQIDFQAVERILDLGCGFGFFTEALAGKLPPDALITGVDLISGHEPLFLQACAHAGARGHFIPDHVSFITTLDDRSFDLILCSYALYFFPEMIRHIARILRPGGVFTTITHDSYNMGELFDCIKDIMNRFHAQKGPLLPVEKIIRNFSAENGTVVLERWFGQVKTIDYPNALVYHQDDIHEIIDYFHFKSPFFLAGTKINGHEIALLLPDLLRQKALAQNGVVISKNDRIFICSDPRPDGVAS